MSEVRVEPASRVDGVVTVPGDKSISHRALILGALARGRSYAGNLSPAEDVASTASCLRACGSWLRDFGRERAAMDGSGAGMSLRSPEEPLDCGNSGTTMRLLAGALAGHDCSATLTGDDSLRRRPMARVADPLRAMGAEVEVSPEGTAPLRVAGRRRLDAIEWRSPVASAQVKSAILLAGLSAGGPTSVIETRPTRDHTERLLRMCGLQVAVGEADGGGGADEGGSRVTLHPGALQPFGLRVPGDISSAAFFLALAASRSGWRVRCPGVGLNPGRTGILDVLRAMGAGVTVEEHDPAGGVEPQGDVEVRGARLRATSISESLTVRCIDELPVVAVLATQCEGATEIRDAGELRAKESDRIAGIAGGLRAFGADCEELPDGLVVRGPVALRPASVDALGDHRLAMAWGIAAALAPPDAGTSRISGAAAASVSYPAFFADLARIMRGS